MTREEQLSDIAARMLESLALVSRSGQFGRVTANEEYDRYRPELEALGVVKPELKPDHYGCQPIPEQ